MSRLTTDRGDPDLTHGADAEPGPQATTYLVLSEAERARGFVRPVRDTYVHVGPVGPCFELRDLTTEERELYADVGFEKFEQYPQDFSSANGKFWTASELAAAAKGGCRGATTMSLQIAETYAAEPKFYGFTYCVHCRMHLPVEEFVWQGTEERVGS